MTFVDITSNESWSRLVESAGKASGSIMSFTTCLIVALGAIVLDSFPAFLLVATYLLAYLLANLKMTRKKRAAESKDEQLYGQGHKRPESDFCPICTLPIPLRMNNHAVVAVCCMKSICHGCNIAAQKRGMSNCAFCRTPIPANDADRLAMVMLRVEKKDPAAIRHLGQIYFFGELGMQKDMRKAVELYTEATELGSIEALFNLGNAYELGEGVGKDKAKAVHLLAKAAMQGHVESRHKLGFLEADEGNYDRAVRHFLISAKMGLNESVENIKRIFMGGQATKEQYAQALKGYQNAVEEMKSHDRDQAKSIGC